MHLILQELCNKMAVLLLEENYYKWFLQHKQQQFQLPAVLMSQLVFLHQLHHLQLRVKFLSL